MVLPQPGQALVRFRDVLARTLRSNAQGCPVTWRVPLRSPDGEPLCYILSVSSLIPLQLVPLARPHPSRVLTVMSLPHPSLPHSLRSPGE